MRFKPPNSDATPGLSLILRRPHGLIWQNRAQTMPMKFLTRLLLFLLAGFVVGSERLEGGIIISEFLAENDGGLVDADGDSPDWIEILNDSSQAVNLGGWHLTDTPANLTRWTFPSTNLPAGGFLVVFASGKNRTTPGGELHTNFQLNNAGGWLALVQPDGAIAHAYDPAYPPQRRNASFGIVQRVRLISSGATGRYHVPTNNNLGATWTSRTFGDSSWTLATNGIGYDRNQPPGTALPVVLAVDFDERGTAPVTQDGFVSFVINSNISSTTIQTNPTTRIYGGLSLTFSNTHPLGYDDRLRTTPVNSGSFTTSALLRDHIMSRELTGTGGLDLAFSGLLPSQPHAVTVWSYDTGSSGRRVSNWYANGVLVRSNYSFDGSILPVTDDDYQFTFAAMTTPEGGLLVSGRRDLSSLANNPAVQINAIRLARVAYRSQLTSDVEAALYNRNSSLYFRLPFTVTDASSLTALELRVRYDDGFVAYVNGQSVAARNAPATPAYNSAATATHLGFDYETIPVPLAPGLLVNGTNILAIHGLNVAPNDTDFFLQAEVMGVVGSNHPVRYHWPPTPGSANGEGYSGFVADTKFSVNRGFYDTPVQVAITSATPSVTIYWTTNGSAPSPTNGFVFQQPILVDRTLAVRAAAYAPGLIPTEVETHSYLFLSQVLTQAAVQPGYPTVWQGSYPADYGMDPNVVNHPVYSQTISNDLRALPTLSVVMAHEDLWGASSGIYRNSTSSGPGWERAASVELIDSNGATRFAVNCGIEIHGNASRDNARTPKHSFRLSFKSEYGPARLRYDWFDDRVRSFDRIVLRGLGFCDAWTTRYSDTSPVPGTSLIGLRYRPENATYLKDTWIKETLREMGHLATRSDFAHLYLNGLYWGLINPSERIDAAFAASHLGGREMDWDVMAGDESYAVAELRDGFRDDWDQLMAQVNAGITNEASYQAVLEKVEVVNLVDYMMVHGVAEMEDWPFHNWYAIHRRATNGLPATRWIFLPWDQEVGMDRFVRRDRILAGADSANTPGRIYTKLRAYPEFRRLYGDRVQKHFFNGGALSLSNCIARFERLGARIFQALVPESARWGDAREFTIGANPGTGQTFTRDEWWVPEMRQLYSNYFGNLHELYLSNFQAAGLYPLTGAPEFSQFGGGVPAGFSLTLSHTNPAGAIFYTLDGSDPREYGTGNVAAGAQAYALPIPINAPTEVNARVLDSRGWSALVAATFYPPQNLQALALTEIMYHPPGLGVTNSDEFEFLELKNCGANTLNLSGLTFSQGISFTFTNGTLLAPGAFFVLVRNPAAFSARYPGVGIGGVFTGKLDNSGETVTLAHPTGTRVWSITWSDSAPWPVAADGLGFSLVPRQPGLTQAPDRGAAWRASAQPGGSPGADDPEPDIPPVVINEVLAHTDPPLLDAVELLNPTGSNALIGGWYLTDDPAMPCKFRLPSDTLIPPGGTVFFDASQFNANPGSPTNFSLSSTGDDVYLFSAGPDGQLTSYSHGVVFGASFNGVSFGRVVNEVGDEFFAPQVARTLGAPNAGPQVGPIVFNEVHYHPEPGGFEFVELLNNSDLAAPLFHGLHPANTWQVNGIGFVFPTNVVLGARELLVLAGADPATFRARYEVPAEVRVLGPFPGALQNDGENLQLLAPDNPNTNGVPYVAVEELRYNDRAPWPAAADGSGLSLQRRNPAAFANSPANWQAAAPTPGRLLAAADTDGDGMPDLWESEHGTNPLAPDAGDDADQDGFTNLQEYLAGTDPQSAQSRFELTATAAPGRVRLSFTAVSNRSYTVLWRDALGGGAWMKWTNVPAHPTNRPVVLEDSPTAGARFYRLTTPAWD